MSDNIDLNETQKDIETFFNNMRDFILEKNRRYGNSATSPINTFSKLNAEDSIAIRMDDKLSRIRNSDELKKNDLLDLLGYISLYAVNKKWLTMDEFLD